MSLHPISHGDLSAEYRTTLPDGFLADEPEGGAFYAAFQRSAVPGFDVGCIEVKRHGSRIATVPVFVMNFSLATMLPPGVLKRLLGWIRLRIACVGHPSADFGRIDGETSAAVLAITNRCIAGAAAITAYKGFPAGLPLDGYVQVRGLPVPLLDIRDDYFAALPSRRRNDLKRKRRASETLRWEISQGLPDHRVDEVYRLYLQTNERAIVHFEKLNRDYFVETAALSEYILAFEEERLVGFAQLISRNGSMLFKYVGMDYRCAHAYGLYFGLLIRMIEHAIDTRTTALDFGVTAYEFKRKLGARMVDTWVYYRHANRMLNAVLKRCAPLLKPGADELE